jgi:hypothetical protein
LYWNESSIHRIKIFLLFHFACAAELNHVALIDKGMVEVMIYLASRVDVVGQIITQTTNLISPREIRGISTEDMIRYSAMEVLASLSSNGW